MSRDVSAFDGTTFNNAMIWGFLIVLLLFGRFLTELPDTP
ncbi:hypothetical protein SAMN05192534_11243 [Alteribacillus persepolensis]|uniref:Uncharacterized protein n=1 Tax=Alteribacillus persepolensis TaxID=568899 RepID=A0A1G8FHX1_9BACI|nr:hypothetical protein SAMN05192534_11243 [Alteribacillus persepolensis]